MNSTQNKSWEQQLKDKLAAKQQSSKKKGQKIEVKIDKSNDPLEVIIEDPKTSSKNLQDLITKDTAIQDLIQELKKIREDNKTLQKQLDNLKQEITIGDKIKSQSIVVKRMCITVLKQYQNNLTSPLAQDAIELLEYIGYNPEQIIKEIKQTKRK